MDKNKSNTVDQSLDRLVDKIETKTLQFVREHEAFNKKANKQAAKRARVLTNDITSLLKLFRKESVKVVKNI